MCDVYYDVYSDHAQCAFVWLYFLEMQSSVWQMMYAYCCSEYHISTTLKTIPVQISFHLLTLSFTVIDR